MKNSIFGKILTLFIFYSLFFSSFSYAKKNIVTATAKLQKNIAVTIYNNDFALVKDKRKVKFGKGESVLEFIDVSGKIKPETAILTGSGIKVIEQNFEYDLLSPRSLIKKFIGKNIHVIRKDKLTGKEIVKTAKILSVNNGVILKIDNHIETKLDGRPIFPYIPDNLREKPTLSMLVKSTSPGEKDIELTYLTEGLSWKADYIAELNATDTSMNIAGWVTLTNRSGISFEHAKLQLVAGKIHKTRNFFKDLGRYNYMRKMVPSSAQPEMTQKPFFEYHLYTLKRRTTVQNNETKQVALFSGSNVKCKKDFILGGSQYYYLGRYEEIGKKIKPGVYITINNSKENGLGIPMPKGIVRVYKKDSEGSLQFVGEDRIGHTPENERIRLKLGEAFDVTAKKIQTDFKKKVLKKRKILECSYKIEIKNAKKESIKIRVIEPIPGEWVILKESYYHKKLSYNKAEWDLNVPAKGKTILNYKVKIKF